ncbi:MAG: DmsE family decaheme c-type cytochrome [Gammaproteobacteria bacterium]|nr:DmsE family decaheme c-type cytochrome [Gammaproteobacteria bacterium]
MFSLIFLLSICSVAFSIALMSPIVLAVQNASSVSPVQAEYAISYTEKGADTCIKCHDEDNEVPILPIFKTKHGRGADRNTPFAALQCESCHGPGAAHAKQARKEGAKLSGSIIHFGVDSVTSVEQQNKQCLSCHENAAGAGWFGSQHESNDVACARCHQTHVAEDTVLVKDKQKTVCFTCHKRQRADIYKRSSHPLRFGSMACTACHDAHGSFAPSALIKATVNETCYTCHAEKRGPVLWPHAPVVEDCTLCHQAHGSNHAALLLHRAVFLCKQCHSPQGHPSLAPSQTALPDGTFRAFGKFLVGKNCLNCHSAIHGSNHPSGVKFLR